MKNIIALTVTGLALAGCASPEERQINDAKSRLRFISSDPGTVEFRDLKVGQVDGEPMVCGFVNMQLRDASERTGAVRFVMAREEGNHMVDLFGGCDFEVAYLPCHEGADPVPLKAACAAEAARTAAQLAEYDAERERLLVCHGLTTKGDTMRDHEQIIAAIRANQYAPGKGPNSPECQV